MKNLFGSKIFIALLLLFIVFLIGVFGFYFFSDYSWIDAFYMTVITVATVGFGEVKPLSPQEKVFVSLLIISSIFILAYAISVITEYILSKKLGESRDSVVQKKMKFMQNHVIVCGYGRNGKQASQKLLAYNQPFVIIEKNEEVVERSSNNETLFVLGDATEDEILLKAGIKKASTLICATPNDADNLFVVLSARQLNKKLKIISRASEETSYKKMKLAGADDVIMPEKIGGDHMASLVVVPDLVEFLGNLTVSGEQDSINVEQIPFEKICPSGQELAIKDLDIRKKTGCSIIGYRSETGEYIVNPGASLVLRRKSNLILIGRPDQIESLKREYGV
ncbi:potassium channel family protein [Aequorivita viscosa]|uniref:Voltage-gated potassium channel n=1 Tax=Aequorivita viscosa TaxID=797419 RepID=A0A1M6B052_9FLAO|nr:potassium channel protein [Aequorivita viscosa]SDW31793.1 voltage-gated potassium channel [Aequorivita viscosa]SHI42134.1 voltage-gated potassium channel [Aequorivita viscosa]